MKNVRKSILSVIAVLSCAVVPYAALAQFGGGPPDECKITKEMTVGRWRVQHLNNDPVAPFYLYVDTNNDGAFTTASPAEMFSASIFPESIGGKVVRDNKLIIIPQSAQKDREGGEVPENFTVKKGDTLPPTWATFCIVHTVNNIVNWVFFILLSIAFAFVVLAGFKWMSSQGNAEKQGEAGKMIFAAIVGIIIAALAKAIPAVIIGLLT